MDNTLNLLGIAKKAGMIAIGGNDVSIATRKGTAKLILSAADASERAVRRAHDGAKMCGATYVALPYNQAELGQMLGRGSPGTVAVLDAGLASAFLKGLATKSATGEE